MNAQIVTFREIGRYLWKLILCGVFNEINKKKQIMLKNFLKSLIAFKIYK